MELGQSNFMDLLKENNEEKLKEYISMNGKKRKPISPVYFWLEEDNEKGDLPHGEQYEDG